MKTRPHAFELGERSQYDVAAELGISRARVAQIERKALRKLRRELLAIGIDCNAFAFPTDVWEPACFGESTGNR